MVRHFHPHQSTRMSLFTLSMRWLISPRGWLIPSICMFPSALAIAELTSAMPVNGAFYWWTAALSPPGWSRPLAFISGWTVITSLVITLSAEMYALASMLSVLVQLLQPAYVATPAQILGIAYAIMFLWVALVHLRIEQNQLLYIACSKYRTLVNIKTFSFSNTASAILVNIAPPLIGHSLNSCSFQPLSRS